MASESAPVGGEAYFPWARTCSSLVAADGRLLMRGSDALYCYDLRKAPTP